MDGAIEFAMRKAGVTELKEKQKECMVRFLEGHGVFGSLPTGYGKSLIYGLLPDIFNQLLIQNISICSLVSTALSPNNLSLFAFAIPSPT